MNLIEDQNRMEQGIMIDWEQMMQVLETDLPQIPAKPVVEQINPPPYALPRLKFGKLMDKDDDDDDKKGKKAAKKAQAKKDGPPPKPIKWADGPPVYVKSTVHHMAQARQDQVENIFPLNIRGDQGNPGIAPCIIKEVYFPPEAPCEVSTLVESALVYQNSANYELAIECFTQAKAKWLDFIKHQEVKTLKKE